MCYRCDECKQSTKPRQKMLKRTIFRTVRHPEGTQGKQIARETKLCRECMDRESQAEQLAG
jgi:hypothetical protein